MEEGLTIAVGIMAFVLLGAYLIPIAFDQWFNTTADTGNGTASNWSQDVIDLWDILPLLALLALILFLIGYAVYKAFDV